MLVGDVEERGWRVMGRGHVEGGFVILGVCWWS